MRVRGIDKHVLDQITPEKLAAFVNAMRYREFPVRAGNDLAAHFRFAKTTSIWQDLEKGEVDLEIMSKRSLVFGLCKIFKCAASDIANFDPDGPDAIDIYKDNKLGSYFRMRRLHQGMGVRELAANVGISVASVSHIENGGKRVKRKFCPHADTRFCKDTKALNAMLAYWKVGLKYISNVEMDVILQLLAELEGSSNHSRTINQRKRHLK